MRLILIIGGLLTLVVSCSGPQRSKVKYGVTTVAELRAEQGEPVGQQAVTPEHPSQVLLYPENAKYQVEGDLVVAGFRDPTPEERSLLYWRHQFRDRVTTFTEVAGSQQTHMAREMQLRCPSAGLTIIYDPNQDLVTRVVEHAQQGN